VDATGRRHLQAYTADLNLETEPSFRTLWKAPAPRPTAAATATRLTCILPLELDLMVLGCGKSMHALAVPNQFTSFPFTGDGYLRKSSLRQLVGQGLSGATTDCVSDMPMRGYITSLHVVQNDRTGEKFILGGADDGSIAFWDMKWVLHYRRHQIRS
jgi:hypothetical protein